MSAKTVSPTELADILGVDPRSLSNFVNEGMPKAARGRFSTRETVQWYLKRQVESARAKRSLNRLEEAKIRKYNADAERVELDLAERTGQLLTIEYAMKILERTATSLVQQLRMAPHWWAPRLADCATELDRRLVLEGLVNELLPMLEKASIAAGDAVENEELSRLGLPPLEVSA